jgi:hypothetical protein
LLILDSHPVENLTWYIVVIKRKIVEIKKKNKKNRPRKKLKSLILLMPKFTDSLYIIENNSLFSINWGFESKATNGNIDATPNISINAVIRVNKNKIKNFFFFFGSK